MMLGLSASSQPVAKALFSNFEPRSQSGKCEICGVTGSDADIWTCKGCQLRVHEKCYDAKGKADEFECGECLYRKEQTELWGEPIEDDLALRDCHLCPVPKSCLRGMKKLMNKSRTLGLAHMICALLLPSAKSVGGTLDISETPDSWEGWKVFPCAICKLKALGACVKCAFPDCPAWAHAACGASAFGAQVGFEINVAKRTLLCPGHSSYASSHPDLAQEFLRLISTGAGSVSAKASSASAKASKKNRTGDAGSAAPGSKRPAGETESRSSKQMKPSGPVKPDASWINRRVSVYLEGFVGTVVKIKRNKFVVALDDGKVQVERRPDEVRLLTEREPGCVVCKRDDRRDKMLLCDGCDLEMHLFCNNPPLSDVPEGKWFCQKCASEVGHTVGKSGNKGKSKKSAPKAKKARSRTKVDANGDDDDDSDFISEDESENEAGSVQVDSIADEESAAPSGKKPSSSARKSAASGSKLRPAGKKSLAGGDDAQEPREDAVAFEYMFPDSSPSVWSNLFAELDRVHRAELIVLFARYGPKSIAEELRKSHTYSKRLTGLITAKVNSQELPAFALEGFILYLKSGRKDAVSEDELAQLKQLWTVHDLKSNLDGLRIEGPEVPPRVLAFELPSRPWVVPAVPQAPSDGSMEVESRREELSRLAQQAAHTCGESLVPVDLSSLLRACLQQAHTISDDFLERFIETCEKLRGDCERAISRARLPAFRARELFRKLESRLRNIRALEPTAKGEWRKTPYPRRPYEGITDYEPAWGGPASVPMLESERDRVLKKLETSKKPECDESDKCSELAPYSLKANGFLTDRPCLSRRVGCRASTIGKNQPLELNKDIVEYDAWGFDSATRKFVDAILEYSAGVRSSAIQTAIVEGFLMKCIHAQPSAHAFDITSSLNYGIAALQSCLHLDAASPSQEAFLLVENSLKFARTMAQQKERCTPVDIYRSLQSLLMVSKMFEIQIRPKGVGIRCEMKSGFKAGTFVSKYLGELYSPWRWFERQDGVKLAQAKVGFKPALPDFYNIMLERHEDDPDGYDVLFVDPIVRGNFASRLCHSCDPNCATVVMAVNGKFVIAVYALRDVDYGEELTFDYSSVTEDEAEFRAAICLCGTASCRGSFLFYAGTGAFASVITTHHTFLDRVASLLMSETAELNEEDEARLTKYGVGNSITGSLPKWTKTWAALILRFVDFERQQLARDLLAKGTFTEETARLEAQGVAENRRQNVAITLDKLGYFLRQSESQEHPLRLLSDEEVTDFLWNSGGSVARRAIESAIESNQLPEPFEDALHEFIDEHPIAENADQARQWLMELKDIFWQCPLNEALAFGESCGDVLLMHALTETWFTSNSYKGFKSVPVAIRNVDIGRDSSATSAAQTTATPVVNGSGATSGALPGSSEDLLAIVAGSSSYQTFVVEKVDSMDDGMVESTMRRLLVYNKQVPGLVAVHVYRTLQGAAEDVVSLQPVQDVARFLFRFSFYAFTENKTRGVSLDELKLRSTDGSSISVFGLSEKTLKKARFEGDISNVPSAATSGSSKLNSSALKVVLNEPKKYQSGFAWGQLVGWFKQTVSDPSASLSAERRGSLSLPDIESCFQKEPDIVKFNKSRRDMLKKIKEKPDGMWPVSWPYSFKNKDKIYGSPWFDDALQAARDGDFTKRNNKCNTFLQTMYAHMDGAARSTSGTPEPDLAGGGDEAAE